MRTPLPGTFNTFRVPLPLRPSLSPTIRSSWLGISRLTHAPTLRLLMLWPRAFGSIRSNHLTKVARPPTFCRDKNWSCFERPLARLPSLVRELFFRVVRLPLATLHDAATTHCTLRRFRNLARDLSFSYEESDLTPSGIATLCQALRHATRSRQSAFKRWKTCLRHSGLPSTQASTAGSNHLAGPDGLPAFHPSTA